MQNKEGNATKNKQKVLSPFRLIILGFACLILLGTALLMNVETGETIPWEGITEISDVSEELESKLSDLRDDMMVDRPDEKTPNPIYIPKHIRHRKKGRR